MTSSNVWLSLLETPSWGWPPLPFLSLSLKHVPSKSPSLQTPPVEPSPDLLPRRPTFLRLATLKGPAQARTQIPPPCPPPVHIQTTRNTQRHGWTQRPPVHTGGSTWSASDPGLTDKYKHSHGLPPPSHTRLTADSEARTVSSTRCSQTRTNIVTRGALSCGGTNGNPEHIVSPPPAPAPACADATQHHDARAARDLVHTAKHIGPTQ